MSDGNKIKIAKEHAVYIDIATPTGRLSHPHIIAIDTMAKKWKIGIILPLEGPLVDKLKAAFVEVAKKCTHPGWPAELKQLQMALKKGDSINASRVLGGKAPNEHLVGKYFLSATRVEAQGPVTVVDPLRNPVDPKRVLGGLNGKLGITIAPYATSELVTKEDGTKYSRIAYGVTAYLNSIMLMGGGEPFGGAGDGTGVFEEDEEVAAAKKAVESGNFSQPGAAAGSAVPAADGDVF